MGLGKFLDLVGFKEICEGLYTPLGEQERHDFLELVEDRYATAATVITSQCPLKEWYHNIGDSTLADAICDRLFHQA